MTEAVHAGSPYAETFRAAAERRGEEPDWLVALRERAIERFTDRGWPTAASEDWKYAGLPARVAGPPLPLSPGARLEGDEARAFLDAGRDYHRITFVNGRLDPASTRIDDLPSGLRVRALGEALDEPRVRQLLEGRLTATADGVTALNLALVDHGAVLEVSPGAVLERPVQILHLGRPREAGFQAHGACLVVAGAGAHLKVVESFVGLDGGRSLRTFFTGLDVGENAAVDYHEVVHEGAGALHLHELSARLGRSARLDAFVLDVAGGFARTDAVLELDGEGAECSLKGLYLTHGEEHVDLRTVVHHRVPHCRSEQTFKGILDGRSSASFNGKVVVHEDAQKTDATQSNRNLLLSDHAVINTRPQLEIYADDVKCAHGATTGRLDENAVFYLQARGIDRPAAEALLTYAFARELVDGVSLAPLRREIDEFLMARLPGGPPSGDPA